MDVGSVAGRNGVAPLTRICRGADLGHASTEGARAQGVCRAGSLHRGRPADRAVTVACLYLPKGGLPAERQKSGGMRDQPDGGVKYERKQRFFAAFARELKPEQAGRAARGREFRSSATSTWRTPSMT